jgi:hypothetical protein
VPKFDAPAKPAYDLDVPKFDVPRSPPPAAVDEGNPEPQEVRDARAAEKNAAFKAAKDEAKVGGAALCRFRLRFRSFLRPPPG